jgi:hypothetical protein
MSSQIAHRITSSIFITLLAFSSSTVMAQADASYPVKVIFETNDGSNPPNCSSQIFNKAGGPPEVTLDLDNDGIQDICLGSVSLSCSDPINLDCSSSSLGSGSDCSEQNSSPTRLMDSNPVAAANFGNPVGPIFDTTANNITVPLLGIPLVIGFQGTSSNAALTGYFELQINDVDGTNCSYSFGNAYVNDGSSGINYGDTPPPPSDGPVTLSGAVELGDGTPLCSIVLASGQFMFTCEPVGPFSLTNLPREPDGTVIRQVYVDGAFPSVDVLPGSTTGTVVMKVAGTCPTYNPPTDPSIFPISAGKWISISGNVLDRDTETPLCAMVLANGQYVFSCDGSGSYALEFPLDGNGQYQLQVYADGFAPTLQTFDEMGSPGDVRMARASECQ